MADDVLVLEGKYQGLSKPTAMDLLSVALHNNATIDVIERLAALQERARDYDARVSFDEALNRCQAKLSRISTDADNEQTRSRYATYAKLDKVTRPIYTGEGFSVSFGERDCPTPGRTRFVAYLSRAGVTREYLKDMTPSTKGPQGKDFMTPIHADAAADSYAKRYLLKDIFNIAIGAEDNDGNDATNGALAEAIKSIVEAPTPDDMKKAYRDAYNKFEAIPAAIKALINVRNAAKKEFDDADSR